MDEFKRKPRIKPNIEQSTKPVEKPIEMGPHEAIDEKVFEVSVTTDFRKFKKGDTFDFSALPINVIVGENGSGKSSLIHAIRGKFQKKADSLFNDDYIKLSKNISIKTGIKKFFFLDSVKDDGANMNNSYDAMSFITNGGFQTKNLSHGETQLYYISKLIGDIEKFTKSSPDEKFMIVLDEFDKGFSLTNQAKVINILHNLTRKYNCKIVCISHNYMLIKKLGVVYDMDKRDFVVSKDYLAKFE